MWDFVHNWSIGRYSAIALSGPLSPLPMTSRLMSHAYNFLCNTYVKVFKVVYILNGLINIVETWIDIRDWFNILYSANHIPVNGLEVMALKSSHINSCPAKL